MPVKVRALLAVKEVAPVTPTVSESPMSLMLKLLPETVRLERPVVPPTTPLMVEAALPESRLKL